MKCKKCGKETEIYNNEGICYDCWDNSQPLTKSGEDIETINRKVDELEQITNMLSMVLSETQKGLKAILKDIKKTKESGNNFLSREEVERKLEKLTADEIIAPAVRFFLEWNTSDCVSVFNLRTGKVEEIDIHHSVRYEDGYILFKVYPLLYSEIALDMILTDDEMGFYSNIKGLDNVRYVCDEKGVDLYDRLFEYLLNSVDMREIYADVEEQLDKIYRENESNINLESNKV